MPHIALLRPVDGDESADGLPATLAASGFTVEEITPAALSEESAFDSVLATSIAHRKTTSHPTLLLLGEPLSAAVAGGRFSNLCSFDGYLGPKESSGLLRHISVSLDKPLMDPVWTDGGDVGAALHQALDALGAAEAARAHALGEPCIDVILRTGGRPSSTVRRAADSLRRQSAGRVRLIVVRHGSLDPDAAIGTPDRALGEVHVVDAPGANRGRALAAGLAAVRSPFFAVLDDDDYILSGHFAGLLTALARSEASRRLAYCDVLKLQEGPPDPTGASALSMLREGVAAGPLTSILERFTSHCFLATSAALAPVRFDHWDLDTGEDSLLVAALLRHAQPVHSSNATAVYSQGADIASGFEDHPQRRADEAALHAETFAWRSEIESRFPAEIPDPLAYLATAVRRWEAPAEATARARVVPAPPGRLSLPDIVSGGQFLGGAFGGDETIFAKVPLSVGRASGDKLYFEPDQGGVQIGPQGPWDIGLKLDISDYVVPGCALRAVAILRAPEGEVGVGLADAAGSLIERTQIPASPDESAAEVVGSCLADIAALVAQAGAQGAPSCRVSEVRLGYVLSELAGALGLAADADEAAITGQLAAMIAHQVSGRPRTSPDRHFAVDYRNPRSVFRHVIEDGPLREGARRVLGTGLKPWDYFAQVYVPRAAVPDARWVRVDLADTSERFTAFLVDDRFTVRLSPAIEVHADKAKVELWLPAPDADAYLILQSGADPQDCPLVLEGVTVAC